MKEWIVKSLCKKKKYTECKRVQRNGSSLDIHLLGPSSIPMTVGPSLLYTYPPHPKQARAESHGNGVRTKQCLQS